MNAYVLRARTCVEIVNERAACIRVLARWSVLLVRKRFISDSEAFKREEREKIAEKKVAMAR